MLTLPIVTALPTPGSIPNDALRVSACNSVEVKGRATAGAGKLYLLRWYPVLDAMLPWREDRPIEVDSAVLSGHFSALYRLPVNAGPEYLLLFDPASAVTATASGRGATY